MAPVCGGGEEETWCDPGTRKSESMEGGGSEGSSMGGGGEDDPRRYWHRDAALERVPKHSEQRCDP